MEVERYTKHVAMYQDGLCHLLCNISREPEELFELSEVVGSRLAASGLTGALKVETNKARELPHLGGEGGTPLP